MSFSKLFTVLLKHKNGIEWRHNASWCKVRLVSWEHCWIGDFPQKAVIITDGVFSYTTT